MKKTSRHAAFIRSSHPAFGPVNVAALALVFSMSSWAETILVDSSINGGFGDANEPSFCPSDKDLVIGHHFSTRGEQIVISASGVINLGGAVPDNGANGAPVRIDSGCNAHCYTPLEQIHIETGLLATPRPGSDVLENVGALFGAFVPLSLTELPNFKARDQRRLQTGELGIPTDQLFLIGAGPVEFQVSEPGILFLGINDPCPNNNVNVTNGGFSVEIQPSSLPALRVKILGGTVAEVRWIALPGASYQLQRSEEVDKWDALGPVIVGDGTERTHVELATGRAFFRVKVE